MAPKRKDEKAPAAKPTMKNEPEPGPESEVTENVESAESESEEPKNMPEQEDEGSEKAAEEVESANAGADSEAAGDQEPASTDEPPTKKARKPKISRRKKKDPNAPKRPLSGYNIFFKELRRKLRDSGESMAFEELVQRVSKEWKGASPERKAECEAEAKKDYERYANEMEVYKQRPEVQSAQGEGANEKDNSIPAIERRRKFIGVSKKPLSGYNVYFREEHARLKRLRNDPTYTGPALDDSSLSVEIAKRWSSLDIKEKQELNTKAALHQREIDAAEKLRDINAANAKARRAGKAAAVGSDAWRASQGSIPQAQLSALAQAGLLPGMVPGGFGGYYMPGMPYMGMPYMPGMGFGMMPGAAPGAAGSGAQGSSSTTESNAADAQGRGQTLPKDAAYGMAPSGDGSFMYVMGGGAPGTSTEGGATPAAQGDSEQSGNAPQVPDPAQYASQQAFMQWQAAQQQMWARQQSMAQWRATTFGGQQASSNQPEQQSAGFKESVSTAEAL